MLVEVIPARMKEADAKENIHYEKVMNNKVLPEIKAAEAQYEKLKNLRTVTMTLDLDYNWLRSAKVERDSREREDSKLTNSMLRLAEHVAAEIALNTLANRSPSKALPSKVFSLTEFLAVWTVDNSLYRSNWIACKIDVLFGVHGCGRWNSKKDTLLKLALRWCSILERSMMRFENPRA
ncbi:hypothetical protein RHSIM_Rhsim10G0136000 [Rhododendron simsii]|uniref:Uncharacterized protein n=1 Tax=Rhododendron simsii TaxID=118357 RepID=A0A834GDC1_RHOSS|nr:hypothetical protein RHSIM_Rhsim10G0136000 [Rhododendron simsii]